MTEVTYFEASGRENTKRVLKIARNAKIWRKTKQTADFLRTNVW